MATRFGEELEFAVSSKALRLANARYVERVNEDALKAELVKPTTTVVLFQDPAPGTQLPLGTPVNLTLASKGDLPVDTLGASEAIANKWQTAGDVEQAVESAAQAAALKAVIAKQPDYAKLSAGDKAVVDSFLSNQLGELSEDARSQAYSDVGFMYQL